MLLKDEKRSVLVWAQSQQVSDLIFWLELESVDIPAIKVLAPMPQLIGVGLVGWLENNTNLAPEVLDNLLQNTPAHGEAAAMTACAERLRVVLKNQSKVVKPYQVCLAGGAPMVNRAPLRSFLERAVSDPDLPVIVVQGEPGLGRSHSWHLIEHVVAALEPAVLVNVDVTAFVKEEQTLEAIFGFILGELSLGGPPAPTTEGTTGGTRGARFANDLASRLRKRAETPAAKPVWFVFDNTDRQVNPDIKSFIKELANLRIAKNFRECVIFLLGPDPQIVIDDPFANAVTEPLGEFLADELTDAAGSLNALGAKPLSDADLATKVAEMTALLGQIKGRALCVAVAKKLVELRIQVQA